MPNVIPLFAVPVFHDNFVISSADKDFCSKLSMEMDELGNFNLSTESRVLNLPQLANIKSAAQSAMDVYTREVLHILGPAQLEITTSWYTTVTDRSIVLNHFHSHSLFTGVIVLDASPGSRLTLSVESPPIVPKVFDFNYGEYNIFNSKSWWLDLEPDSIYIFPSTVNHLAKLSEENTSMNVIAFDTFVNGRIGEKLNEIHITTT
jgi:hypothetical protein